MSISAELRRLVVGHRQGESLAGPFYVDAGIFAHEAAHFLGAQWLLAGHTSQIPQPGDYFTVDALGAALVVVRAGDGSINALHNVCRHRGARICEAHGGHTALLRCRYHGWSYKLSGELAAWRHMPEGLDRRSYGLRRCGVTVFEGLIFVSLDPERAPDPGTLLNPVRAYWQRYELEHCKVAAERTYTIGANWKLCIENNLECYHCLANHPEYTSVNAFVGADERVSDSTVQSFASYLRDWECQMRGRGVPTGRSELTTVGGQLCRAGTSPLAPGKVTASRDGRGLAPLLGRVGAYDESVTTGCFGFLSYLMAACDYALTVTYLPVEARTTHIVMRWLVREDAVAGRDYDMDELCFVWDETTKQDKHLIELNAAGVTTAGYVPGPYSLLESLVADFIDRYVALMRGSP
jgi:Rieske 2Fe-2S family protein